MSEAAEDHGRIHAAWKERFWWILILMFLVFICG